MELQELLNKWNIKCDINTLLSMWNEPHRFYHNLGHLNYLIDSINADKGKFSQKEYEKLLITALFHDCIYDTNQNDNEEKSAEFFMNCASNKDNDDIKEIKEMILDTKNHKTSNKLSQAFIDYDMSIVQGDINSLMDWENGIHQEYKQYGDKYKEGRLQFLESLLDKYPNNSRNLLELIEWVKNNY